MRPALFTTANQKIDELMQELQKKKLHIAIVLDEFGGTVGLITLEDILEELVGEIWDEHDEVVQEIVQISEREYKFSGAGFICGLIISHLAAIFATSSATTAL